MRILLSAKTKNIIEAIASMGCENKIGVSHGYVAEWEKAGYENIVVPCEDRDSRQWGVLQENIDNFYLTEEEDTDYSQIGGLCWDGTDIELLDSFLELDKEFTTWCWESANEQAEIGFDPDFWEKID